VPEHPVFDAAERFRAQALAREREAANRLVQTYGRAYTRLSPAIESLSQRIAKMDAPGPSRASLARLESLRSLQNQVETEVNRFAVYADQEVSRAATAAIQAGLSDSRALAAAAMGGTGPGARALISGWDMLPTESVETMLGFLADDSPLHSALVKRLGPAVAERMSDALVDGIVLGMNPRRVAEIVRKELGVGLTWALTTARTAQLNAYREASRANYVANGHIVGGWTWLAALDARTCMSCLNMHGSFHPVTEALNDHHNGRCVAIPNVKQAKAFGLPQPDIEPGQQWFERQPEAFQRERMGPGMFDAWKAGKFDFRDLSQPYQDPVYGEMLREATLKGLLTGKAKGKTLTFGTPAPERGEAEAVTVAPRTAQPGAARISKLKEIEGRIIDQKKESASIVDDNGNELLFKDGNKTSVSFTRKESALFEGNTLTHNHPIQIKTAGGMTFSNSDMATLNNTKLKSIRAVTYDPTGQPIVYEMVVDSPEFYDLKASTIKSTYTRINNAKSAEIFPEVRAGTLEVGAANAKRADEVILKFVETVNKKGENNLLSYYINGVKQ
jgi:SPP1 gp7 family putative phage head morphogenesis protein